MVTLIFGKYGEMILKNIRNQSRHQKKDLDIDCKEAIMLSVVGFIQKLATYDYKNAEIGVKGKRLIKLF